MFKKIFGMSAITLLFWLLFFLWLFDKGKQNKGK